MYWSGTGWVTINSMSVKRQKITATAGQRIFNLTDLRYIPGNGCLSVFIDGAKQFGGYIETDATTVTFDTDAYADSEYLFEVYTSKNYTGGVYGNTVALDVKREVITASANQTLFTLTTMSYPHGSNALMVYINGQRATSGYTETSDSSITFATGAAAGDVYLFESYTPISAVRYTGTTESTSSGTGSSTRIPITVSVNAPTSANSIVGDLWYDTLNKAYNFWDGVRWTNLVTNSVINSATNSVTNSVTNSAINSATNSATNSVTNSAINSVTNSVTNSATNSAINSATNSDINSVTNSVINSVINSATNSATFVLGLQDFVRY
jgi:hypothetical protein